jgi:FkbM family methyltransferase
MQSSPLPFPISDRPLTEILGFDCRIKVVDIGANPIDGAPPYRPLIRKGLAEIVGFEPNPEALAELQGKKGPHESYLPHAVGDGKRHELKFCAASGMTSLLEPNEELLKLFHGFSEWSKIVGRDSVDTVRLDDVPETGGLDLLKIDIQGAELMVFENAPVRLDGALVVQTEVEFVPMYRDQPLFSDVDRLLRGHGFLLHRFDDIVSRVVKPLAVNANSMAGMSQQLWTDAIYVKDFTRPDRLSPEQLIKLAVILHECYGSYDLVMHFLQAHDQRLGTAHSATYLGFLRAALTQP